MNATYSQPSALNNFWLGFVTGLVLPLLIFILYFLFRFHDLAVGRYFKLLIETGKIVHVISLAVFPNLVPFLLFVRTDRYRAGRGIMTITVLYAILIFGLKLVF